MRRHRLRATPLRPSTILATHVLVKLFFTAITLTLLILAGRRYYPIDLHVPIGAFALALGSALVLCRILRYMAPQSSAPKTAKVFRNNRSQAVRLPKEFQFDTQEVFIRKEGDEVILSPRPPDWNAYLASGPVASDEFMEDVEDLPVQERER